MTRRMVMCLVLALAALISSQAQDGRYPNLWQVAVQVKITYSEREQMYYFDYTLTNKDSNRGSIDQLEIDISKEPGTIDLDTVGLRFENDEFTEGSFRRNFPSLEGKIVPVGVLQTPGVTWIGGLTDNLTASFGADSGFVEPGRSLGGFELVSKGVPAIRRCIVSPYFDVMVLFPDSDDTTVTYSPPPVDSVREAVKFRGLTIGPAAPPLNLVPAVFIDTLISYKHQALALGWIKDPGTTTSLDQKLNNARQQLERGNTKSAKNILEAFVNEVEALNKQGKQITSEAYALLKYNAEYLISKLE